MVKIKSQNDHLEHFWPKAAPRSFQGDAEGSRWEQFKLDFIEKNRVWARPGPHFLVKMSVGSRNSSGTRLGGSVDAERAYGHSRSSFLFGNA